MMTGCGTGNFISAVETEDKINLLQKGKYYGHPNAKRAAVDNDPRQCVWRNPTTTASSENFSAPFLIMKASTDGIVEYHADHFDGQLRGNLITSKYTDGLSRVVLTDDGLNVVPESLQALPLVGDWGLDVTQAPNGNLIEVRLPSNALYYHKPVEDITSQLRIVSVFPSRGSNAGGSILYVYGVNLNIGSNFIITIGDSNCLVQTLTDTLATCSVPGGANGRVDVTASSDAGSYTFKKGYRYISGFKYRYQ
jgi:IPT/TIG domain